MTFQVRLYIHHDNDLIQLHLNGVRLCDVFAKSLEAHYKKEQIQFILPEKLEFKPHKGKVYRVKVTLDDKKQGDMIKWVCAFPDQYKCHCIKNIARAYLGTTVIDALNGMTGSGAWVPDRKNQDDKARAVQVKKWKKKEDTDDGGTQWIDRVSASRQKTEEQIRRAEEGRERIRNLPVEEILGTRQPDSADGTTSQDGKETAEVDKEQPHGLKAPEVSGVAAGAGSGMQNADSIPMANPVPETGTAGDIGESHADTDPNAVNTSLGGDGTFLDAGSAIDVSQDIDDDFDALLQFERMRSQ